MNISLRPLPINALTIDQPSPLDLFDAQGKLLLAKGQPVSAQILRLLVAREIYTIKLDWSPADSTSRASKFPPELYQEILSIAEGLYLSGNLLRQDALDKTISIIDSMINELASHPRTHVELNRFRTFDNYTYVHSVNVAILSTQVGLQLGYPSLALRRLALGAFVHDLGKMAIPLTILNKPAHLTSEEFEVIKSHPLKGVEKVSHLNIVTDIQNAIRHHHEKWNGKGYPDHLSGLQIPRNALIVSVADVFDALTADRPYRRGLPPYHALEMIIAGSGQDFSPEIVAAFKLCLVLYPENSIVKLNTGETGIVLAVPKDLPTRPLVRILFDQFGNYVNSYTTIDLLEDLTRFINSVEIHSESKA